MSGSDSSSSASAAAWSRKRSSSPAAAHSAEAVAAPPPPPHLHSAVASPPPKKARKNPLPACAFARDAEARALTLVPAPSARLWRVLSPAQRCFSDGLALSFSFLSLAELVRVAAVCKAWLTAAKKANIAPAALNYPSFGLSTGLVRWLPVSPFCRHVHAITHNANNVNAAVNGFYAKKQKEWTIRGLAELGKMPELRRISGLQIITASAGQPNPAGTGCAAFSFPPLLESADLHFKHDKVLKVSSAGHGPSGSAELRCVLRALRPCHSLTELSLTLRDSIELVLSGLLEMASLHILTIDIQPARVGSDRFTEAHIGVVKRLPNLRRLALLDCSTTWLPGNPPMTSWLRWLSILPHKLQQLGELDLSRFYVHLEHMQLLQRLPALTALQPAMMFGSALPLLPSFATHLRMLNLCVSIVGIEELGPELFDFDFACLRASFFLPHLLPCSRLAHLTVSWCVFDEAEATALCQTLTQLRELKLINVHWPSFESLRHLPLLESLSLQQPFPCMRRSLLLHAAHVTPLIQLRHLTLSRALNQPLTGALSALVSALRPPSALMPALVGFHYLP